MNLPDEEAKNMRVIFQDFPEQKGLFDKQLVPIEGSINEPVFREGKPMIVDNLEQIRIYPEEYRRALGEGIQCGCLLPVINRNRVLGVLSLARRTRECFQEDEVAFLIQVANQLALALENALVYEQTTALKDKLIQEKLYLEDEIRGSMDFQEIIGTSASLLDVLQQVQTVAPTDSTVLILGETGTGKELIARAIHSCSRRKDRTFVKMNCAAIPTGLLESELFGHEKGAFTGAITQRIGRLELADQGTLFLDEIGDISLESQSKLLRALQEREFERLGSSRTRKVDIRLIVATNRDLRKMVADNQFRSDLFYRLNVFPIRIPPLRERPGDIPLLVRHFTQKYARRMKKRIESIPSHIMNKFKRWHWPGNIRELENFIERAVILTSGTVLNVPVSELSEAAPVTKIPETESERDQIIQVLKETKGRVGGPDGAAKRLGIKRTTLLARMKKFGINPHHWF
jgi:formate hydrogenlyase transcriptional activator